MVLQGRLCGRVGRCRVSWACHFDRSDRPDFFSAPDRHRISTNRPMRGGVVLAMSRRAMLFTRSVVAVAVAAAACTPPSGPRALLDIPVTSSQERDPAELNARIDAAAAEG